MLEACFLHCTSACCYLCCTHLESDGVFENRWKVEEVRLNLEDALLIFFRIAFDWCTAEGRRTAFRRVGILGNCLAPELVDRSHLNLQPTPVSGRALYRPPEPLESPAKPKKQRQNSAAYYSELYVSERALRLKAAEQLTQAHAHIKELEQRIPEPNAAQPKKKSRKDLTKQTGSLTLNNIQAQQEEIQATEDANLAARAQARTERETAKQAAAQAKTDARLTREALAASSSRAAAEQAFTARAAWERCHPAPSQAWSCQCECSDSCAQKKLKLCHYCGIVKKRVCSTKACKEKRATTHTSAPDGVHVTTEQDKDDGDDSEGSLPLQAGQFRDAMETSESPEGSSKESSDQYPEGPNEVHSSEEGSSEELQD